jgi:hypothetical protein
MLFCLWDHEILAQAPNPPTDLNQITITSCGDPDQIDRSIAAERRRGLVLDAQPFAVNQSTGKVQFNGKTGRVAVINMNPFVYKYRISVAQQELVSSAVSDFISILLPPGLRPTGNTQSGERTFAVATTTTKPLDTIADRFKNFTAANCPSATEIGCQAILAMKGEYKAIDDAIANDFAVLTDAPPTAFDTYKNDLTALRNEEAGPNEEAGSYLTCKNASTLKTHLDTFFASADLPKAIEKANREIADIKSLSNDLEKLADEFTTDDKLKDYPARCSGFSCGSQFKAYAEAALDLLGTFERDGAALATTLKEMRDSQRLTTAMADQQGLFARSFEIEKRYELSDATIAITREPLKPTSEGQAAATESGIKPPKSAALGGTSTPGSGASKRGDGDDKQAANENGQKPKEGDKKEDNQGEAGNGNTLAGAQVQESIRIGNPRFLLSGGLVYSPLARQTFESVKGFTLDANGNPTGSGDKTVIGFGENSPRRLLPMVLLNSRITGTSAASLFFSLGVTAKHDDNLDVEYLIGPSVSFLNDRALFTFGAYGGKTQQLVPDVRFGDEIPDSAGDAKLFTKRMSWKPGFSFSYVFSDTSNPSKLNGGGGSGAGPQADLKDEIRIGAIPFNLAVGLAYTSLEERTYDEVLGIARDREGNPTNGNTLTRIVGLTSSSSYRLVPLVMLHTRLLNFGGHSIYFTTGVGGKKTDDTLQIEYLLGSSINLYRRKLFFTFGTFAGKQQVLGNGFFTGGPLPKDQSVTIVSRYVWKPAFAFSYDISRILKRGEQ